jgi:hypothetical protein
MEAGFVPGWEPGFAWSSSVDAQSAVGARGGGCPVVGVSRSLGQLGPFL